MFKYLHKLFIIIKNKHFLSLTGNAVMSVLGMVTYGLLSHALSLEEMGIWIFFTTGYLLLETFRSGFLTTAFIKFYAGASVEKAEEIVASSWYIALLITLGFIGLNIPAFFLEDYISDIGFSLLLKWFGITYIVSLPYYMATNMMQGEQRFDRLLYIRTINTASFIIFITGLIITGKVNLQYVLYAYLLSFFITSLFVVLKGWSGIQLFNRKSKESVLALYNFGKFSVGTTISANLFRTSDTIIIKVFLGDAALAIYNLGQKLLEIIEIPLRSFAATAMPSLSTAYNQAKNKLVIEEMSKYIGLLTIFLIPAAILSLFLADFAIALIGGPQYTQTEAANVLRLFMLFALLYPADRFMALTLDVIHKPRVNFIKVMVMLAANIIFDIIGVFTLGNIYGLALATLVPTLIAVGVGYFALQDYQKFSFISLYKGSWQTIVAIIKTRKLT
ncbi:lipopolysaccharide biosynthesis protein [Pedobacter glucosidilyticus]|uniref:lipopolysaccharide biosynthesis protein n=1 Tax=Pedobacter glucosidilyticus TaxID=1122941 RepID=UPI0004250362|nr:oligosaccharide flippase family protein [Pedobacter glucosidilyticus]